MLNLSLAIPEEMLLALKLTPDALLYEIKLSAAIKLYELGRLSSGAAAEFAGIPKPVFLHKLADYGVTVFRLTESELKEDMNNA
jgi:predicted HTH domain antitoxin